MRPFSVVLALACGAAPPLALDAQVRLNEAVSANRNFFDDDGDAPDWIELTNLGAEVVDLRDWSLSDRLDQRRKWVFGPTWILPGAHDVVWAGGRDRQYFPARETLISRGDPARYLVPDGPVDPAWAEPDFDDGAWGTGPTGIGFGDGDDATLVPDGTRSVFLRQAFDIDDVDGLRRVVLHVDADDGFVAYLNGVEVARRRMSGARPPYDAPASGETEAALPQGRAPRSYILFDYRSVVREGTNVLAVQVHNAEASDDLSLATYLLVGRDPYREGTRAPAPELRVPVRYPSADFKISSEGETVYLFTPDSVLVDSLEVSGVRGYGSVGISPADGRRVFYDEPTPGAPNGDLGYTEVVPGTVTFSRASGLYGGAVDLALAGGGAGTQIRYTLDATVPDASSPPYTGPLTLDTSTVVRARIFGAPGVRPSDVATAVYLIGVRHDLDVASLTTDPANLFDPDDGIYVLGRGYEGPPPFSGSNLYSGREVPVHFGLYPRDADAPAVTVDAGARLFGGFSRANAQRSFALFMRGAYGASALRYPLFPNRDYVRFESFVLRNSGNDWQYSYMRDATLTGLMAGSGLDYQDYRPVATYLNGQYWGLYNLREKVNEDFIASRHDVDAGDVTILEKDANPVEGSPDDYKALIAYVEQTDLSSDEAFARVAAEVDVDNYATYQSAQVYLDNRDWPGNNIKFWRTPETKWRWILFDTDFGASLFDRRSYEFNSLARVIEPVLQPGINPEWATVLLRGMLANEGFRHRFINRMADHMNSRFRPANALALVDRNAERIASEIPRIEARWGQRNTWANQVDKMREFLRERPAIFKQHVLSGFDLPAFHALTIAIADTTEGAVQVNSIRVEGPTWTGDYFETVPVTVTAVAKTGHAFSHWRHDATLADSTLVVDLTAARTLEPVFRPLATSVRETRGGSALISDLVVGPIPTSGSLTVSFALAPGAEASATLVDQLGRVMARRSLPEGITGPQRLDFNLSGLPSGGYWLEVEDGAGGSERVGVVRR